MDYNTIIAQKGADNKSALDEQKKKDDEHKAKLNDRSYYDKLKAEINSGAHANWDKDTKDDWQIVNKRFNGPTSSAMQKQSDDLSSQMPLVPTSEDITAATGATPEEQVAASQETQKLASEGPDIKPNYSATKNPDVSGAGDIFDTKSYLNNLKDKYSGIEDYYKNSVSDTFNNMGDADKKLLIFDAIGTLAKNISKYRLPMYSAYGKSYEGQEMGDEKSNLQKGLEAAYQSGLERRNKRLDTQLDQQLKVANFPSDLQIAVQSKLASGRVDNKTKMELLDILGDMSLSHAAKISLVQGILNTNPVQTAFNIGSKAL